jgi:two-component system sensor kinase FixL
MNWVTIIFSMTASACLTLALIYGLIWWRQRDAWANLLFSLAAIGTAATAATDLATLRSESTVQLAAAIRWSHLANWLMIVSLAWFVLLYFRAGRPWLLWTVCGLRTVSLVLNFTTGENLNYREITSVSRLPFLGETASSVGAGVANPWMIVGQLSLWALLIFVIDASITVWRRGDRRTAVIVGGSIVLFLLMGAGQAALIVWRELPWPSTTSLFYLGIIAAMGYEFGSDALRARRLASELQTRDQQLSIAAEAANMGFWFRDLKRQEFGASERWRQQFGFSSSETLLFDDFLQRLHPGDRESTIQAMERAYQSDGIYQTEHRVLLPDGQVRWFACQGRLTFDEDRKPLGLHGVSLDVTRHRLAELEAEKHRNEVAHLLRVAGMDELSSTLAHELKQPLTAILSNAQAANLFLAGDRFDLDEIREILRDIIAQNIRANEVIDRLRALIRKGEFQPQQLEASDLILEVLKLLNYDLVIHGIRVITEFSPNLPSIRADRVQLEQVLINLILNAKDAMAHSKQEARTLTVSARTVQGSFIEISVADTGGGIAPGSEEKIFEPYHTTKPQGLGLGLSLSRSIVLAHRGRLWVENRATGGAIFHCRIPEFRATRNSYVDAAPLVS